LEAQDWAKGAVREEPQVAGVPAAAAALAAPVWLRMELREGTEALAAHLPYWAHLTSLEAAVEEGLTQGFQLETAVLAEEVAVAQVFLQVPTVLLIRAVAVAAVVTAI
jgi:hypothetical protein